jgi:hypothetical protein
LDSECTVLLIVKRRTGFLPARKVKMLLRFIFAVIGVVAILVTGCVPGTPTPVTQPPPLETEYIGRVIDAASQAPIAGAKVSLDFQGVPPIVYTDSEGIFRFKLSLNTDSSGTVRVEAPNYRTYTRIITISPGSRLTEDIRLPPIEATSSPASTALNSTVASTSISTQVRQPPTVTQTAIPTRPPNPSPVPTITLPPTAVLIIPTTTPTSGCIDLLHGTWHLAGSDPLEEYNGAMDYQLRDKLFIRVTYDLHGLTALPGDASAIIFDQPVNQGWHFISLSDYGQNGMDGQQTVDIPLADFSGLNLNEAVGTLHTRFWSEDNYVVDIVSIKACR